MFDPKTIETNAAIVGKIAEEIVEQVQDVESFDQIDMLFVRDNVQRLVTDLHFAVRQVTL